MHLSRTGAEYAYWHLTSDSSLQGSPYVAVVDANASPTASTVWTVAAWSEAEVVTGPTHTRTMRLLLAGPDNGTNPGSPLVVPVGEWATYVRIDASPERIERSLGRLYVE